MIVYTIGHSTRSAADFLALLEREGVRRLVDISTFPGSRKFPQFNQDTLAESLGAHGIAYEHQPALGGRRRPSRDAPPSAWRNEGFRGYAEYMRTPAFHAALDQLVAEAAHEPLAIMCSEAVPWRCHRNLVSDALVARGVDVRHITDGKLSAHAITPFALVRGAEVTYPAPNEASVQESLPLDRE